MEQRAPIGPRAKWMVATCLATCLACAHAADNGEGPLASQGEPPRIDESSTSRHASRHVGLSVGTARFNMPCLEGLVCKRSGKAITLYAGGDLSQRWGFELAYMRMSNMVRDGNALRVKGLNVSLIGELPLASRLNLVGRVGTNYAWTRMDQAMALGQPTNSARGFGVSYGAGLNVDIAQGWNASFDWNRHGVKFVTGRESVDTATLSLRYRY